jgi:hypothetical protein
VTNPPVAKNFNYLPIPISKSAFTTTTAAVMTRPKITLYVDTVSPFAYEAYYILRVCFPRGYSGGCV